MLPGLVRCASNKSWCLHVRPAPTLEPRGIAGFIGVWKRDKASLAKPRFKRQSARLVSCEPVTVFSLPSA